MIFSENRYPLFRIMLYFTSAQPPSASGRNACSAATVETSL
jgi:hypothetical protein